MDPEACSNYYPAICIRKGRSLWSHLRRTLKYRLYRSKHDRVLVGRIEYASEIWNHFVALSRRYYRLYGTYPGYYKLKRHLTKLKRQRRFQHWNEVGSQAAQMVIQRLDLSYQAYFDSKAGKRSRVGLPSFKKRTKYTSFTLTQAGWKYLGANRMRIGSRTFKFVLCREVTGTIKTVTIKRDRCGDLWLCLCVVESAAHPTPHEEVMHPVGMDFGLKTFLTLSDGSEIESPLFLREGQVEIARLNRALSRKRKGSRHWRAARRGLARAHRRIAWKRRDWFFKTAHDLCDRFDFMGIEDLSLKGMQRLWGRKVNDLAFGEFVEILTYVCHKRGVVLHQVERSYPSSKRCSRCGVVNEKLTLSDRHWRCVCGVAHDRDANASINIRDRAWSLFRGAVRPSIAAARAA